MQIANTSDSKQEMRTESLRVKLSATLRGSKVQRVIGSTSALAGDRPPRLPNTRGTPLAIDGFRHRVMRLKFLNSDKSRSLVEHVNERFARTDRSWGSKSEFKPKQHYTSVTLSLHDSLNCKIKRKQNNACVLRRCELMVGYNTRWRIRVQL